MRVLTRSDTWCFRVELAKAKVLAMPMHTAIPKTINTPRVTKHVAHGLKKEDGIKD